MNKLDKLTGLMSGRPCDVGEEELSEMDTFLDWLMPPRGGIMGEQSLSEQGSGEGSLSPAATAQRDGDTATTPTQYAPAVPATVPLRPTTSKSITSGSPTPSRPFVKRVRTWGAVAAAALVLLSWWMWWGSVASEKAGLRAQLAEEQRQRKDAEEKLAAAEGQGGFPAAAPFGPLGPRGGWGPTFGDGQPRFGSGQPRRDEMPRPDLKYGTWEYYSDGQFEKLRQWILQQPYRSDEERQLALRWYEQNNSNVKFWVDWCTRYSRMNGRSILQPR
jgi:hypothetical protein